MRSPRVNRLAAALAIAGLTISGLTIGAFAIVRPAIGAESVRLLVQSSPLAGSQYHALSRVWADVRVGDRLTLAREPHNRHDSHAVRVEWKGAKLGYVPRSENRAVARALDAGERLEARVSKRRDDPDPWRRVEFEVYLVL